MKNNLNKSLDGKEINDDLVFFVGLRNAIILAVPMWVLIILFIRKIL